MMTLSDLCSLEGHFRYCKLLHWLYLNNTPNVQSHLQRSDVMCERLFLLSYSIEGLLCDAERDLLAIAKFFYI